MNKGLKALKELSDELYYCNDKEMTKTHVESRLVIEKELKALDIIKNKQVDVVLFVKSKSAIDYNGLRMIMFRKQAERDFSGVLLKYGLNQEEFDTLKEVLL